MRRWFRRSKGDGPRADADWIARQIEARGSHASALLAALRSVPREGFVPPQLARQAYEDGALPIGYGQTISQPYIVARMTQALALGDWAAAHDGARPKVLDVGTGSGYQAAILAALGAEVVSIELEPELAEQARLRLIGLGYDVKVITGDGSRGAPEEAPFAAIVVAAAAPDVPVPLVEQLMLDGRLVLPIGSRLEQVITLVRPTADGFTREPIESAVFVPLLGEHGFGSR
ncbi:MAG TPA: protein-L-isoaspartate(D-aspartate) O-methyltransferase [Candidatus Limnocylindria bacterium]|nr:protein-L-isoaspartate(D-aspartate) O-methyltransferase [Candidatus Limnocylindria bacterium]